MDCALRLFRHFAGACLCLPVSAYAVIASPSDWALDAPGIAADAAAPAEPTPLTEAEIGAILADARLVGHESRPELIVTMPLDPALRAMGVTAAQRVYRGICGPDGAVADPADLSEHARRDLAAQGQTARATVTENLGTSPTFRVTYDDADQPLATIYMPKVREAAAYIGNQLDNRVNINVSLGTVNIASGSQGTFGIPTYTLPWSVYVNGLRSQSRREGDQMPALLPDAALPVRYDNSSTVTQETQIRVTGPQLRAIFGDNALSQTAVDFSLNINTNTAALLWAGACDGNPSQARTWLVDIVVHEFTHALGFESQLQDAFVAGPFNNPNNAVSALDVSRFLPGLQPIFPSQIATTPRLGEGSFGTPHLYANPADGFFTTLESGDGHEPRHLVYIQDFDDKLGIMDPVRVQNTSRCPDFYTQADLGILDDIGWKPVTFLPTTDCNANGIPDFVELTALTDVDDDRVLDACEFFVPQIPDPGTPQGITYTVWETPGLTQLSDFGPFLPGATISSSTRRPTLNETFTFPSAAPRVIVVSGAILIPQRDEYAFRLGHTDDMHVVIDGFSVLSSTTSGSLSTSTANPSVQGFIQLDAGWHEIDIQILTTGSSAAINLIAQFNGTWDNFFPTELSTLDFVDCNSNGTNDFIEPDCDGDGVPDDCEADTNANGIPDDCELDCDNNGTPDITDRTADLNNAQDLGIVGTPNTPTVIETVGSSFDTELALWSGETALLIESNDDIGGGNLQSRITRTLPAGEYVVAVAGFNASFTDFLPGSPGISFGSCSNSGTVNFSINGVADSPAALASGRAHFYRFTIADDCDADGTFDDDELDCDADGIPDDCQRPDDDVFIGTVGTDAAPIVISTRGSDFDTQIAVWSIATGELIDQNDDIDFPDIPQSELILDLDPGEYVLGLGGYFMLIDDNLYTLPSPIAVNGGGVCSSGGSVVLNVGSFSDSAIVPAGRAFLISFEVEQSPACSPADLNADGFINFADVQAFVSAFNAMDPAADVNGDGSINFADVQAFVTAFNLGC